MWLRVSWNKRHRDLPAPHVVDELRSAVFGDHPLPSFQRPPVLGIEALFGPGEQATWIDPGLDRALESIEGIGDLCLLVRPLVISADRLDHLGEIPGALRGDDVLFGGVGEGQVQGRLQCQAVAPELGDESAVEAVGTRVVEIRGHGEVHGQPRGVSCRRPGGCAGTACGRRAGHRRPLAYRPC